MELEKLKEIIAGILNVDKDEIMPDTTFAADLGADSLDAFQIVTEIEEVFGITLDEAETERIVSVKDAVEVIRRAIG